MKHPMMIKILMGFALAMVGAQAYALAITPASCGSTYVLGTSCWTGTSPTNPDVDDAISITGISGLVEVYKQDQGAATDTGSFASSYQTTFANTSTDPEDALIEYLTGPIISCPECILLVKDGAAHTPVWYMFDIGNVATWNGVDDIALTDFWIGSGAISHVTIFSNPVPEPGILALLGVGLLGMTSLRRLKKTS